MALQHVAGAAAVTDFVSDVKGGPLMLAVQKLSRVTAGVAGQSWRGKGRGSR